MRDNEVDINTPEGLVTVENDWVLAMTGYQPNLSFCVSWELIFQMMLYANQLTMVKPMKPM